MPLQNRVDPFGELFAAPARGLFMGNRGGRFHTDAQRLTARRWVSRQWICCVTKFKARQREVWGRFYTELFFLDEPTAFAAGHRGGIGGGLSTALASECVSARPPRKRGATALSLGMPP